MTKRIIDFPNTAFPSIALESGAALADHLDKTNSPILFGCRDGACAHCLVFVESTKNGTLEPPDEHEQETLSIFAPENPKARLGCQLSATCDISLSIEK